MEHKDNIASDNVREQIKSLLSDFYPSSPQYLAYIRANERITKRTEKMNSILTALRESTPLIEKLPTKFRAVTLANRYLSYVEIFGNFYVDLTLLLLVGKGQALHLMPDNEHRYVRHAASLDDLESPALSLAVKLDILESNGLSFFEKWFDKTLRNRIAHADFVIDDKGNISYIDGRGREKSTDLTQEISRFNDYLDVISSVFREEIGKAFKSNP